jgi:hypothetical protein
MQEKTKLVTASAPLTCTECGRTWLNPSERWRLYVDPDERLQTFAYCAACAEREFGSTN